jgi:hypothetical protein
MTVVVRVDRAAFPHEYLDQFTWSWQSVVLSRARTHSRTWTAGWVQVEANAGNQAKQRVHSHVLQREMKIRWRWRQAKLSVRTNQIGSVLEQIGGYSSFVRQTGQVERG